MVAPLPRKEEPNVALQVQVLSSRPTLLEAVMNDEIVAEQWLHDCVRSTKRDGKPLFDGKKWYCSRCEGGYYVDVRGCSQEEANEMFWMYLAHVCFKRQDLETCVKA